MSSLPIRNIKLPDWLRENKRLRTAVILCVSLLSANILLYALLVAPSGARIQAGEMRYRELIKRRTEAILFEKRKEQLAGLRAGIPTQQDMPLLIKELVQTARRLNVSVSSINYDVPRRSGEELAQLSFSLPAEGRYADVKRFIYEIETSDRLLGIQDVKFAGEKGRVKVLMRLVTYIRG